MSYNCITEAKPGILLYFGPVWGFFFSLGADINTEYFIHALFKYSIMEILYLHILYAS